MPTERGCGLCGNVLYSLDSDNTRPIGLDVDKKRIGLQKMIAFNSILFYVNRWSFSVSDFY